MERIISARVDESVAVLIGTLAQRLHTSKKRVIEEAMKAYSGAVGVHADDALLDSTAGCWCRKEAPEVTVAHARKAFNAAYRRHHR